jgi:hypothetical protein
MITLETDHEVRETKQRKLLAIRLITCREFNGGQRSLHLSSNLIKAITKQLRGFRTQLEYITNIGHLIIVKNDDVMHKGRAVRISPTRPLNGTEVNREPSRQRERQAHGH